MPSKNSYSMDDASEYEIIYSKTHTHIIPPYTIWGIKSDFKLEYTVEYGITVYKVF